LFETRPAMIIRSLCRGLPRNTSAPKRAISNRDALVAIISIAQQASPNVIGQSEFFRAQLIAWSALVSIKLSARPAVPSASMRWYSSAGASPSWI
jgi:hypothetical protein